jgi:Tfp pilus assembly protein PilX
MTGCLPIYLRRLRATARDESGFVMIVALAALTVASLLVGVAVMVAVQTNGSTRQNANKINALEAAEAGLQVATYRLNMLRPSDNYCVGDGAVLPTSGLCASSSYTMGNGATYSYYTTPTLTSSAQCVGLSLVGNTNLSQRCITAVGTANGVTQRAQIRVAAFGAIPLFPVAGITALNQLTEGNVANVNGYEATNGQLSVGNNATYTGCELGPGGNLTGQGAGTACLALPGPIVLGPVDPGTSNQTIASGSCSPPPAGEPAFGGVWCNDDYRISNGLAAPKVAPYDQSNGITYDAANRILSVSHPNASLTLSGGIYNLCEFDAPNNVTISLAPGTKAAIYIDSPDDPNSGCPPTCPSTDACSGQKTGQFNLDNNVTFLNPSADPLALQLYVYGWNNGQNTVNFGNNTAFQGLLYAPQSILNMSNNSTNSTFTGAISGRIVNVSNNFHFTWWGAAGNLQASSTGLYYRVAWAQCHSVPTTSAPDSGCG